MMPRANMSDFSSQFSPLIRSGLMYRAVPACMLPLEWPSAEPWVVSTPVGAEYQIEIQSVAQLDISIGYICIIG